MTTTATKYMTTPQAARQLGIHASKLSRLFRQGKLPQVGRLGDRRVLSADDVERIRLILDAANGKAE